MKVWINIQKVKFCGWLHMSLLQKFDSFSRKSIKFQLVVLVSIIVLGLCLVNTCWERFTGHSDLYDMFVQSINPSSTDVRGIHLNTIQQLLTVVSFVLTSFLVTGLMVSILVNWMERRHEKWMQGDVNYNVKKKFVLIIGGHRMVAALCEQILQQDKPHFIVIQTRRPALSLRKEINTKIHVEHHSRVVIYNGSRCSDYDLKKLHADKANKIFIIGENKEIDGYDHDTCNLQCFHYLAELTKDAERKIPCHVMFSYQSTFHVFQYTDVSNGGQKLDFIPFNIFRVTAQQVLVNNEIGVQKYIPLDSHEGISPESDKFVHLIIVGMSRMGSAMAVEAAHLCHFPNFFTKEERPRTLITFIDRNAEQETNFFKGRYSNMFSLARSRYIKMDNTTPLSGLYDPHRTTFVDPLRDGTSRFTDCDLGENFIDIDWEFIEGDIACPSVQRYLVEAASDDKAITTVAICLPVTIEAISASMYMPEKVYRSKNVIQVLVQQTTNSSIVKALSEKVKDGDEIFTKLRPFGVFSDCDYLKLSSNQLPQFVAYMYEHPDFQFNMLFWGGKLHCEEAEKVWNNINSGKGKSIIAQKISNYCFAEMIGVKQRSFKLVSGDKKLTDVDLIKLIAKVEHNRWNIEQLLIGYRPLLKEEIQLEGETQKDYKARLKMTKRAHLDLVAYDKLSDDSRKYDKLFSAQLPVLLKIMDLLKKPKNNRTMNNENYMPQPIDTSTVVLPSELTSLVEQMAKNVHEVWAQGRLKEGWTYGPVRDDAKKTHPCLVPYEELPESEKEYDRNTSVETLKLIMKSGFKIEKD